MKNTTTIKVPQSKVEAAILLSDLGKIQQDRVLLEEKIAEAVRKVHAEHAATLQNIDSRLESISKALASFAMAHRDSLCSKGKSVDLGTGKIAWRTTPPKVTIENEPTVIAYIKQLGAEEMFLRITEEVRRDALTASEESRRMASTMPGGITITQREDLNITPSGGKTIKIEGEPESV